MTQAEITATLRPTPPWAGSWLANSEHPSPTPQHRHTGIGKDPSTANSWLLRSPGILSRRVRRGFLPRRQQLLDQPSPGMRNPSHQLIGISGANDVPDRRRTAGEHPRLLIATPDRWEIGPRCRKTASNKRRDRPPRRRELRSILRNFDRWTWQFGPDCLLQGNTAQFLIRLPAEPRPASAAAARSRL